MGLLTETAAPAKEVLGVEQIAVVADRGYFKIEDIEACEKAGMEPYVPRPQRGPSVRAGLFRKDEFEYDPESDTVVCPLNHPLIFHELFQCGRIACPAITRRSSPGGATRTA